MPSAHKRTIFFVCETLKITNPIADNTISTDLLNLFFLFLNESFNQVESHFKDQLRQTIQQNKRLPTSSNAGRMAGMSGTMERVNGLQLLLLPFVLLASFLATVSTTKDNCYNGPAPVIVNKNADVYLGTYVWACCFRVANHTALTINHVGDGAKSQSQSLKLIDFS